MNNKAVEDDKKVKYNIKNGLTKPLYVYVIIGILLLVVIILLVALLLGGSKNNELVEPPISVVDNNNGKLTDNEVKRIYQEEMPFIESDTLLINTYSTDKVTISTGNNSFFRAFAFLKIQFKDGDITSYKDSNGLEMCADVGCTFDNMYKQGWYMYDAALLQEKAKYLYGTEIDNGDFAEYIGVYNTYKDNYYYHKVIAQSNLLSYHYREFVSYEVVDDTLYINDKYLYIYGVLDSRRENYSVTIYGDSTKNNKIGSGTYLVADNLVDFIVPNYDRKKVNYRHAFKKADDGHWYWISSEPVK